MMNVLFFSLSKRLLKRLLIVFVRRLRVRVVFVFSSTPPRYDFETNEMVFSYVDLLPRGRHEFPLELSVILLFVQVVKNGAANQEPFPRDFFYVALSKTKRARQTNCTVQ